MTPRRLRSWLPLAALALTWHSALGAPAGDPAALIDDAIASFDRAAAMAGDAAGDPSALPAFRAAMLDAGAGFETAATAGPPTAGLYRNAATAYAFSGEMGRAVLMARRAERLDPTDPAVRSMLGHLRTRVSTRVDADARSSTERALLAWRGHVPRAALLWTAGVSYTVAVLAAGVVLVVPAATRTTARPGSPRRHARGVAIGAGAVSLLTGAPLAIEGVLASRDRDAVVIADAVTGFNGPNPALYAPTFDRPIGAGMEVRLIETDDAHARVRLRSGQDTWVRRDSIELVTPR